MEEKSIPQGPPLPMPPPQWMAALDERTQKHIVYARVYAREFAHGAPGHLDLMTIAALAKILDDKEYQRAK
jgi:hypothetical protein